MTLPTHTDCPETSTIELPTTTSSTADDVNSTESPSTNSSTQVDVVVGIGKYMYSCLCNTCYLQPQHYNAWTKQ